ASTSGKLGRARMRRRHEAHAGSALLSETVKVLASSIKSLPSAGCQILPCVLEFTTAGARDEDQFGEGKAPNRQYGDCMLDLVPLLTLALAVLAVALSGILLSRLRAVVGQPGLSQEQAIGLFRGEHDRLRDAVDAQFRGMRTETADVMRGLQDSGVRNFGEL